MILLGAGECGKSTILKQMKIINMDGFTKDDFDQYKGIIYSNTVQSLGSVVKAIDLLKIAYSEPTSVEDGLLVIKRIDEFADCEPFGDELLKAMQRLWKDNGITEAFNRYHIFWEKMCSYFFRSNFTEICFILKSNVTYGSFKSV